ncbi:MAG: hypothetical protein LBU85_04560 [Treponema sp.]|jgi:hypothetical protein|nr:hypothetical protein [Treponema sp.]
MNTFCFTDADDPVDIRHDNVFKAVFTRDTPASKTALSKLKKVVEKPVAEMSAAEYWAVYFRYLTNIKKRRKINEILKREEGIVMASEVLMTISRDEVERTRLMSEHKRQLDIQSKLVHAKRMGMEKGREEIINLLKSGKSPEEIIKGFIK